MADVVVKKNGMEFIRVPREMVLDISHTADGIVITFKDGFLMRYSDVYMPSHTKEMIRTSLNIANATLEIDVANYNKPVTLNMITA